MRNNSVRAKAKDEDITRSVGKLKIRYESNFKLWLKLILKYFNLLLTLVGHIGEERRFGQKILVIQCTTLEELEEMGTEMQDPDLKK